MKAKEFNMQLNEAVREAISILSEIHVGNMTPIAEEAWKSAIKIVEDGLQLTQQKSDIPLPCCGYEDTSVLKWHPYNNVAQCHNCGKVYTSHQPPRQPLTEEQVWASNKIMAVNADIGLSMVKLMMITRAVEAAHGIK